MRDAHLVDRAFSDDLTLLPVASIPVPGPVGVLDALAAAALARSVGVPAGAIADAVTSFRVGRHRAEVVAVADGITYVDDSAPPTRTPRGLRCLHTRGWYGSPVACSRARRFTPRLRRWRRGWSVRC